MPIDPLLPVIMTGRPLTLNNKTRAKIVADTVILARDLEGSRERIAATALEQIEFAQAEALARHAEDCPQPAAIGTTAHLAIDSKK